MQWNNDDVRFVQDKFTQLDMHSASSLKQESAGRYVVPLAHITLIPRQLVFDIAP